MSLIRKHVAVLQAWACLALVFIRSMAGSKLMSTDRFLFSTICLLRFFVDNTHVICVKRFCSNLFECECFSIGADMLGEHQFARERRAWVWLGGGQLQRWLQRQLDAGSQLYFTRTCSARCRGNLVITPRHLQTCDGRCWHRGLGGDQLWDEVRLPGVGQCRRVTAVRTLHRHTAISPHLDVLADTPLQHYR